MLESIGALSLIAIAIFLLVRATENKEIRIKEKQELIKHSWACKILIQKYEKSLKEGRPIMSRKELDKKINELLNDENEKEEIKRSIERKENFEKQYEQQKRKKRKVGYKYEENIFSIYHDNRELKKEILINEIKREFKLANSEEAEKVFDIWKENNLISICAWNNEMFEIGAVLKDEYYKIDDEDIIWKDWIKDRNIELKPESEELKNYLNELPF